jgi:hypothetical protein
MPHGRLVATLIAFFLAVGVGAHALDELHGHPLQTQLSDRVLIALAAISITLATMIGCYGAFTVSPWIGVWVIAGVLLVLAYNLELAGGRFHTDWWFAIGWGGFPALVGYFAMTGAIRLPGLLVAGGCMALSLGQRALSTPARRLRRRTASVEGTQRLRDGTEIALSRDELVAPLDGALRALSCGVVLIAIAAVLARW